MEMPDRSLRTPVPADAEDAVVQLPPAVVFKFYWWRRSAALQWEAPIAQMEATTLSLLHDIATCAQARRRRAINGATHRNVRHRVLASNAQAIMTAAPAGPHAIEHIARRLNTSPFHLAHVFRAEVGVPIHRYLTELRILEALDRLRDGAPCLSKLALELGFSHHSHFSAQFRRAVGHSPRDVRSMLTATTAASFHRHSRMVYGADEPPDALH